MPDKFPTSPSDGEQHTNSLGTIYQYQAVDDKWYIIGGAHNDLSGLNDGDNYEHITQTQKNALHAILTNLTQLGTRNHNDLLNIDAGDINHLTDVQVTALHAFIDAYTKAEINGMDIHPQSHNLASHSTEAHSELTGYNDEANVKHLTDAQVSLLHTATVGGDLTHDSITLPNGNANEQHLTSAQVSALHAKQHAMDSATYHTINAANTTFNASTTKHGFLKVLDNDNTHFMDGQGNWAVPTGSGFMSNVVEDETPQLGGDLDLNGNNIDFPSVANISDVKDEDDMASNSATMLATQQSIKAYTDTKSMMATGTYTGDSVIDRVITSGLAFTPKALWLFQQWNASWTGAQGFYWKHEDFATWNAFYSGGTGVVDSIRLDVNGFTVGHDALGDNCNITGKPYFWIAWG